MTSQPLLRLKVPLSLFTIHQLARSVAKKFVRFGTLFNKIICAVIDTIASFALISSPVVITISQAKRSQ